MSSLQGPDVHTETKSQHTSSPFCIFAFAGLVHAQMSRCPDVAINVIDFTLNPSGIWFLLGTRILGSRPTYCIFCITQKQVAGVRNMKWDWT